MTSIECCLVLELLFSRPVIIILAITFSSFLVNLTYVPMHLWVDFLTTAYKKRWISMVNSLMRDKLTLGLPKFSIKIGIIDAIYCSISNEF